MRLGCGWRCNRARGEHGGRGESGLHARGNLPSVMLSPTFPKEIWIFSLVESLTHRRNTIIDNTHTAAGGTSARDQHDLPQDAAFTEGADEGLRLAALLE